jgi:hypothetical protein
MTRDDVRHRFAGALPRLHRHCGIARAGRLGHTRIDASEARKPVLTGPVVGLGGTRHVDLGT